MKIAKAAVVEYCKSNNLAYWDLYEIMGGYGSMIRWYTAGLSAKDRLHFNRKGYEIQGRLLYKAITDAYQKRVKK